MGVIARSFAFIFVTQVINQVSTHHQPITQYLLSNYGQATNSPVLNAQRPQPVLPNLPPTVSTPPATPLSKPPPAPKPDLNGPLDSNVLNNLAIALQLLIVSNIMNMPTDTESLSRFESLSVPKLAKFESNNQYATPVVSYLPSTSAYVEKALSKPGLYSYEAQPKASLYTYEAQTLGKPSLAGLPKSSVYSYESQSSPNANFLGSSGFAEPMYGSSLGMARSNPRSSMTLMSPYDALGPSSFSDPSSSFPSLYSKKDFQSPYASIMAADEAKDLFSMADFF